MPFDHFIVVDWSARNAPSPVKPHKDAIWLSEGGAKSKRKVTKYFRTRQRCFQYLVKRLGTLAKAGACVFVGFDLSFAYPAGFAKALKIKEKPAWKAIWETIHLLIKDDERNQNNRFQVAAELNRRINTPLGPFWGVPAGQSGIFLGAKKDFSFPIKTKKRFLAEKRMVERRHAGMQSAWKLAYTGSVGSQALMGIPYLYKLRFLEEQLRDISLVWPFETGFSTDPLGANGAQIVYAEIWPSLVDRPKKDEIPDREQVRCYLDWLRAMQAENCLKDLFDVPDLLSKKEVKMCINEEGWILGA